MTHKALIVKEIPGTVLLEERRTPSPQAGELLIRVKVAGCALYQSESPMHAH